MPVGTPGNVKESLRWDPESGRPVAPCVPGPATLEEGPFTGIRIAPAGAYGIRKFTVNNVESE